MGGFRHLGVLPTIGFGAPDALKPDEAFVSVMSVGDGQSVIVVMGGRGFMFDIKPEGLEVWNKELDETRRAVALGIKQTIMAGQVPGYVAKYAAKGG